MSDQTKVIVDDGVRITKAAAIEAVKTAADDLLKELPTSDYVEACVELAQYFGAGGVAVMRGGRL